MFLLHHNYKKVCPLYFTLPLEYVFRPCDNCVCPFCACWVIQIWYVQTNRTISISLNTSKLKSSFTPYLSFFLRLFCRLMQFPLLVYFKFGLAIRFRLNAFQSTKSTTMDYNLIVINNTIWDGVQKIFPGLLLHSLQLKFEQETKNNIVSRKLY